MKIAVIGAGISGLAASYWLGQHHDVELYEAAAKLGGHAHTVDVEIEGEQQSIDTGFVVFNDWTYPNFIALLDELGVASEPTSMSFSVRDDSTGLEYNGTSLNGVFAQRRNLCSPRFWRMLRDIVRFNRLGHAFLAESSSSSVDRDSTIAQFLKQHHFSHQFSAQYLLPMGSAIWSCPPGAFEQFPVRFILEFYKNHGLLNLLRRPTWRFVQGGSRTYVEALQKRLRGKVHLNTPVKQVVRTAEHAKLCCRNGEWRSYDHVVFACHSDQALRLLTVPTATEKEILSAFRYEPNSVILHTDESILPNSRRAWASWNYWVPQTDENSPSPPAARVTYNMNMLQKLRSRRTYCISLNSEPWINPALILRRYNYAHPVFTTKRDQAQARHTKLINQNRTSFAGAYWRNGFHEDGVVSALAVCQVLNRPATN